MDSIECFTLASGEYKYGLAALLNSLATSGIPTCVHVGHDGDLKLRLQPNAPVTMNLLEARPKWFGNRKAEFVLRHASGPFMFFDADCIVTDARAIKRVAEMIGDMPVFCVEGIVPREDIRRELWRKRLSQHSDSEERRVMSPSPGRTHSDTYFNSGFFAGHAVRDRRLFEQWMGVIDNSLAGFGALFDDAIFPMADQDCLNAILQDHQQPFSAISPPDVWYAAGGSAPYFHLGLSTSASLLHCTGPDKPWRLKTVPARPPNPYDRAWFKFAFEEVSWVNMELEFTFISKSWFRGGLGGRLFQQVSWLREKWENVYRSLPGH